VGADHRARHGVFCCVTFLGPLLSSGQDIKPQHGRSDPRLPPSRFLCRYEPRGLLFRVLKPHSLLPTY
jgi:hypothetical protein